MPTKLSTTIKNVILLENKTNADLINGFFNYLKSNSTLETYQNQNLKALINFAKFLGPNIDFYHISTKEEITRFLDTKIKSREEDPDQKWMWTWNDYLQRLKY